MLIKNCIIIILLVLKSVDTVASLFSEPTLARVKDPSISTMFGALVLSLSSLFVPIVALELTTAGTGRMLEFLAQVSSY